MCCDSIVFVHGLTGEGESTWTKKPAEEPWPKTLLHEDMPRARIMSFTYDADIVNAGTPAGENRIAEHARSLTGQVEMKRHKNKDKDRPIVFVAHSLGGLVVKNVCKL
jgi:predicted alpha/beta hydrolase family esterase